MRSTDYLKNMATQKYFISLTTILLLCMDYNNSKRLGHSHLQIMKQYQQFQQFINIYSILQLSDVSVLRQIQCLPELECLNLSGNPISKHPNYKIFLLTALPNLKNLDGKTITEEMRISCEIKAKQQTQLLQLMLRNFCSIIQMNSLQKKVDIHKEMAGVHANRFGRNLEFKGEQQTISTFKRAFDLHTSYDDEIKEQLQDLLLNDILEIFLTIQSKMQGQEEDNYERAFQEMLNQQNIKLAELDVNTTKKLQSFSQFFVELKKKFMASTLPTNNKDASFQNDKQNKQMKTGVPSKSPQKSLESTAKGKLLSSKSAASLKGGISNKKQQQLDEDERDIFSRVNVSKLNESFNPTSPSMENNFVSENDLQREQDPAFNSQSSGQFQQPKSPLQQQRTFSRQEFQPNPKKQNKLFSPARTEGASSRKNIHMQDELFLHGDQYQSSSDNSPNRTIPQPTSKDGGKKNTKYSINNNSTNENDCCRKLMKGAKESSQELSQSTTPYKRRNKELEILVGELNKKMESKEEEINKLRQYTSNIKEKLVEIKSTSDEQLKQGNQEINELLNQSEQGRQRNQLLEAEVKQLREELTRLMIVSGQLNEVERSQILQLEHQRQLEDELDELRREKMNDEKADAFRSMQLKKKGLKYLSKCVQLSKQIRKFKYNKKSAVNKLLVKQCFNFMRRYFIIKKLNRVQIQEQSIQLLVNSFKSWKSNIKFSKKINRFNNKVNLSLKERALQSWKQYATQVEKKKRIENQTKEFINRNAKIKAMKALKINYRSSILSEKELAAYQSKAVIFDSSKKKRKFWKLWKVYLSEYARPMQNKLNSAIKLRNLSLYSFGFNLLIQNRKQSVQNTIKVNKYILYQKKKKLKLIFSFLCEKYLNIAREKHEQQSLANLFFTKRMIQLWKHAYKYSRHLKKMEEAAKQFSLKQIMKRHFVALRQLKDKSRKHALLGRAVETKRHTNNKRNLVHLWFRVSMNKQKERIERESREKDIKRNIFQQWNQFVENRLHKKRRQQQVQKVYEEKQKQLLKDSFNSWIKIVKRRNRNNQVIQNMLAKKKVLIKRISFQQFMKESRVALQKNILNMKNQQSLLAADWKENRAHLQTIDEERGEIASKSRELMDQNLLLQEKVVELNQEINSLRRQNQNNDKVEMNQNEVIKELQDKLQQADNHIREIANDHQQQIDQEEVAQRNLRQENKQLLKDISVLQQQLEEKQNELDEYDKAVANNTRQLVSKNRDAEDKLKNSITMASEFRNKLEQQETEIDRLERRVIELEDADVKQRDHIQECVNVITQFESTYEQKVNEYQHYIDSLELQLNEKQNQVQEQNILINQQQQDLNTLRYSVSLLQEEQSNNVKSFIQNLHYPQNSQRKRSASPEEDTIKKSNIFINNNNNNSSISNNNNYGTSRNYHMNSEGYAKNESTSPVNNNLNSNYNNNNNSVSQRSSSREFKIIQKQLSRQRTQMKDKIRCLTQQIETDIFQDGNNLQEENGNNRHAMTSVSLHQPTSSKKIVPKMNAFTASFFTDSKTQPPTPKTDKPILQKQQYQLLSQQQPQQQSQQQQQDSSKLQSNNSRTGLSRTTSVLNNIPISSRTTPKAIKSNNSIPYGDANLNNNNNNNNMNGMSYSSFNFNPHISQNDFLQSQQQQLQSQISPTDNYQIPNRAESSREIRANKASSNDLSAIMLPTDDILLEFEKIKSQRKNISNQLKTRMQNLQDNVQHDIEFLNSGNMNTN